MVYNKQLHVLPCSDLSDQKIFKLVKKLAMDVYLSFINILHNSKLQKLKKTSIQSQTCHKFWKLSDFQERLKHSALRTYNFMTLFYVRHDIKRYTVSQATTVSWKMHIF